MTMTPISTKAPCVLIFTVMLLSLVSCGGTESSTTTPETTYPGTPEEVSPEAQGPGNLDPYIEVEGKSTRRLTVDQLRRSIPALFGGITWTYQDQRRGEIQLLDGLSRTLGEADYIEVTIPNEEPNPIFHKFMDDMASQVCEKALILDEGAGSPADRVVVRYPEDPDANLRFLRLKLHSIYVPEDQTEGIEDYRQLYDDIRSETGQDHDAWLGVCITMLTAPEFMAY
jgi:hypothetical protein